MNIPLDFSTRNKSYHRHSRHCLCNQNHNWTFFLWNDERPFRNTQLQKKSRAFMKCHVGVKIPLTLSNCCRVDLAHFCSLQRSKEMGPVILILNKSNYFFLYHFPFLFQSWQTGCEVILLISTLWFVCSQVQKSFYFCLMCYTFHWEVHAQTKSLKLMAWLWTLSW